MNTKDLADLDWTPKGKQTPDCRQKSKETLEGFTAYCAAHPEMRFWQAVTSFSGYKYLYGQEDGSQVAVAMDMDDNTVQLEDVFYKE